jgi:hypothetical protein
MAFNNLLASMRKIGRKAVLPTDRIKSICRKALAGKNIETILDFGAGTLFWTNWFVQEFKSKVYAVDVYYNNTVMPTRDNVIYYSDISICLQENTEFSLAWACDVLHHLSPSNTDAFLKEICNKTDIIIIKDIDANHGFGNYMNKMHDKIINNETIHDIYPEKIVSYLKSRGYKTSLYFIPKIWYPHFLLVGIRNN